MKNTDFLNDAARCGAIVGVLLALSGVVELSLMFSGRFGLMVLLLLEYVGVVALHFYLLYAAVRRRSRLCEPAEGFSFGRGYGFVLTASAFAGLILGVVNYVHIHLVMGYDTYVERLSELIARLMSMNGAAISGPFMQLIDQIRETPEPSILATVLGGVWSSVLFGLLFGLIIAGVLARAPQPFDSQDND